MIHETAIIDPSAKLGNNVSVGPWTIIGANVEIGDDCDIRSHVVIKGPTKIGARNTIYQFASVGEDCQDKKYAGEPTRLEIGDDNVIRESVTIHRGTIQDEGVTRIGDRNLLMAYVHVAHDCVIGNDNIFANLVTLAGHVHVGDQVILGGLTGVHQFCKIGSHAFAAVNSIVVQDIPPFVMAQGHNARPRTINSEGLKRRQFSEPEIRNIRRAYKLLYRSSLTVEEALQQIAALEEPKLTGFIEFIANSQRGIIRP
ncbi:acyl-[acyl-carrier-protein]--UDP-N-acetylglucosamine O-acyltransferase [Idiomarina fontislapidosi]|uniref:Acyl-[acyl-carrier-protein]--UDP-N-acetylglucosamine O-acyltransferase n=1 Tax=Idiomarina fontislapidosi TaxID=263723 RepID=A0A432YBP4_9GAMM|nr:acyl-ACP--UDP-N-acetylglucosamine O-acyltransferase [Idiomarina fontislapidosi]PYE35466.1 acyl-[acyl-carrier-protein]--UDP-N-acetylglucosamine O-acyltransferase [Idiomarina fontislapidosi]RUO58347.1 acyl-[acyl-carrier-protein]--UDP-N-acetylglucosamine O-acyltransferase [Idiomarina fontislapidosi]